jgi:hypothetical protein
MKRGSSWHGILQKFRLALRGLHDSATPSNQCRVIGELNFKFPPTDERMWADEKSKKYQPLQFQPPPIVTLRNHDPCYWVKASLSCYLLNLFPEVIDITSAHLTIFPNLVTGLAELEESEDGSIVRSLISDEARIVTDCLFLDQFWVSRAWA